MGLSVTLSTEIMNANFWNSNTTMVEIMFSCCCP